MKKNPVWIVALLVIALGGCATQSSNGPGSQTARPATRMELTILLAESLFQEPQEVMAAWVAYGYLLLTRMKEADNRYTFEADLDACKAMLIMWRTSKGENAQLRDESVDAMLGADAAGFLREYVWVFHKDQSWQTPADLRLVEFESWRQAALGAATPKKRAIVVPQQREPGSDQFRAWVGE